VFIFLYFIVLLFLGERGLPGPDGSPGTKGIDIDTE